MEQLMMYPAAGAQVLRFVGDRLAFSLSRADGRPLPEGWRGFLRTTLGRAHLLRQEIIHAHTGRLALHNAAWHDIPMQLQEGKWQRELTMAETGYFRAKAYARDARGWQYWPAGADVGVSVHPDSYRTANTIYCAFVRMFGDTRTALSTRNERLDALFAPLDKEGYTIIPPSGKLRDLVRELPHIIDVLGCRILHLLPVTPTPTTYAKFGRYGSPYAVQDLTAIDPALVEFDKRTTGIDQFRELTYATHLKGGRVFLDVVPNHTGWGSGLHEERPEWFVRNEAGEFISPGAWGTTWEDLVELDHRNPELWERLGDVFLTWCRRGVDGFRCDAGYKIPTPAWEYITARVLDEFPETIFLLEGLGGSWEATENLLTAGGMQWAYSELFQNYSGSDVARYLDYSLAQSERRGVYVHYSETHDNDRLAKKGRAWSLLRNRLCALASVSGGFGFACGVEWLAPEKINVHSCRGLAWGNPENLLSELARLNRLLAEHPCFLDGAALVRQSAVDSPVYALSRVSAEGVDRVLALVNTDVNRPQIFRLRELVYKELGEPHFDLLTAQALKVKRTGKGEVEFTLEPGGSVCLANTETPQGLSGEAYRRARARAAWAVMALNEVLPAEEIGPHDWRALAARVEADPAGFLGLLSHLKPERSRQDLAAALDEAAAQCPFPNVVRWSLIDGRRITLVPPGHWLLLEDDAPFRADLVLRDQVVHVSSIIINGWHVAFFGPNQPAGEAQLQLERYANKDPKIEAQIRFLPAEPQVPELAVTRINPAEDEPLIGRELGLALLTNGLGGMARMQVDLGEVRSKYDCVLGANLHPSVPVDRHIFVKRIRAWVVADGFITALNRESLVSFTPGPPACWRFVVSTGNGRAVEIHLVADMLPERNTTVLRFVRPNLPPAFGRDLPASSQVSLTVRVDLVDRNFHWERRRDPGSEHYFNVNSRPLHGPVGFEFYPPGHVGLRTVSDGGQYHHQPEWCMGVAHPVEASRGMAAQEDAYSPGWFELPVPKNSSVSLVLSADHNFPAGEEVKEFEKAREVLNQRALASAQLPPTDLFGQRLALAIQAFVVRRESGKTIIAGYPWFLDWGRDSLICARGLLAAGLAEEVKQLLVTYGRFEANGTLPNSIMGEDTSNRDTSDAPLWYGLACEEAAQLEGWNGDSLSPENVSLRQTRGQAVPAPSTAAPGLYATRVNTQGRTIAGVLQAIATGYMRGTPNGIRMDPASGLIWSPSHFTWMDTNYPAGTPREGYPVEIQALWIKLLRQLARINAPAMGEAWEQLAQRAEESLLKYFWLPERGYLADVLEAERNRPAAEAVASTALRSNYLFAISLGILEGEKARTAVQAALRYLVVPGALRTLAPLPITPPLPIRDAQGRLLNNPDVPYCGRYEGDEDTRRKPAYHNGTAWTWTFPTCCEALARAWNFAPPALAAARAYLGSMDRLLIEGCVGHLPEIVDGDTPHLQRGCDAQSWGVTEALRVWKLLGRQTQDGAKEV